MNAGPRPAGPHNATTKGWADGPQSGLQRVTAEGTPNRRPGISFTRSLLLLPLLTGRSAPESVPAEPAHLSDTIRRLNAQPRGAAASPCAEPRQVSAKGWRESAQVHMIGATSETETAAEPRTGPAATTAASTPDGARLLAQNLIVRRVSWRAPWGSPRRRNGGCTPALARRWALRPAGSA
jgi:hypothetical protein